MSALDLTNDPWLLSTTDLTFVNPVLAHDFADPFILQAGGYHYAYSTNTPQQHLPVQRSLDLIHWQTLDDAFPRLPQWASWGFTWAPDILPVQHGYVLYYTARHKASGQQVIGAAFSRSPEGPFLDTSSAPLISQHNLGGAIDAHAFTDVDGQRYLYWKNDGNSRRQRTYLWVQRLSASGLRLLGEPKKLLCNDLKWENHLVESPFLHVQDGLYYLFYSAAHYGDSTYCVGYGVASSPLGPFRKSATPLLRSNREVAGPGGQGVLTDQHGQTWMYYHAWTRGQVGYERGGVRSLRLDPLHWEGGLPVMYGPSVHVQFAPAARPLAAD